jgi:hypothetical protein
MYNIYGLTPYGQCLLVGQPASDFTLSSSSPPPFIIIIMPATVTISLLTATCRVSIVVVQGFEVETETL